MHMELAPIPGKSMSVSDIDQRISKLNRQFQELFNASKDDGGYLKHANTFKHITEEMGALKVQKTHLLEQQRSNSAANRRIQDAVDILNSGSADISEWDESVIRQLVDTVKVLSADRIMVCLRGGMEIEQEMQQ